MIISNNKYEINDKVNYLGYVAVVCAYRWNSNKTWEYYIDYNNKPEWVKESEISKYSDILPEHIKKWLKDFIKPFKNDIRSIYFDSVRMNISIENKSESIWIPYINEEDYKKVEKFHFYSLEDLGLL